MENRSTAPVTIRTPQQRRITFRDHGPQQVFRSFWENRKLIARLVRQEILSRYRGSALGLAWAVITPLLMLAVYTFVFSAVFVVRWKVETGGQVEFALVLFAGLIIFQFFAECLGRAPGLMIENPSYIKKVVFPLEALAWVSIGAAGVNSLISLTILVLGYFIVMGPLPYTALWLPIIVIPMILTAAGIVWFLSAVGIYIRDVRQFVGVIVSLLMFASPIFYPVSALPERFRELIYLNPLTLLIEETRGILLFGNEPNILAILVFTLVSAGIAWLGFVWFQLSRSGFADVV